MPQLHFFTTEECEIKDHANCRENYEGIGIKAKCVCNCHKKIENRKLSTGLKRTAEQGGQSKLRTFGESICNTT
ncbi:MAG TPA: hypothetical protein VH415_11580 [Nitrososphaeraceae archaeon]